MLAPCLAAGLLSAPLASAADVSLSLANVTVSRAAVDDVTCSSPQIGNSCIVVTCEGCEQAIPDEDELVQSIEITEQDLEGVGVRDCTINSLNFALELAHTYVGDLRVSLAHGATEVFLYDPPASCDADMIDAIFSDQGTAAPNTCPATGGVALMPDEPLSALNGTMLVGDWTLTVADLLPQDTGMVNGWRFAVDTTCTPTSGSACTPGPNVLCLGAGNRFRVETAFETRTGLTGVGTGVELTTDTGYFWFFNDTNVEAVVKVLNGCGINNRYWVFAGGLTDVETLLRVTDTQNGTVKMYFNPQQTPFQPIQDTSAFATCP
ncbi:MAG TPA: proprotein convertase P-domain-containing protein [Thermoanaerobaculia bacterium]|nr:proprotein convertase P-domain-containing protein [Thermoanaerobaculia bacterium]